MKIFSRILTAVLVVAMLSACAPVPTESSFQLNPEDFVTDKVFITVADTPPNPFIAEDLQAYKDLGFTHILLTEDNVSLAEGGKLSEQYQQAIQTLTDTGMEVWIRNMYNDPDYFQTAEDKTGSNYGTPYSIAARDITTEFQAFPAVTGFYMMDEPFMVTKTDDPATEDREDLHPAFDQLEGLISWRNTYYPNTFWHINHVPNTSYDHWPSGQTYEDFIGNYVDTVITKLEGTGGKSICMDCYPLEEGGTLKDGFLYCVLTVGNATRDYNATVPADRKATCGICLQTFQDTQLKLRTIESSNDITFQMFTAMAAGAQLFEYFLYRSIEGIGLFGIVSTEGKTPIYDYVAEANERAMHYQQVLTAFEYQGMTVNQGSQSETEEPFENVRHMLCDDTGSLTRLDSRYDAIAGHFQKGDQDGYMVVNYTNPTLEQTNVVTLTFADCTEVLIYTEQGWQQQNLVDGGVLRLTLGCGEAAFVIPA